VLELLDGLPYPAPADRTDTRVSASNGFGYAAWQANILLPALTITQSEMEGYRSQAYSLNNRVSAIATDYTGHNPAPRYEALQGAIPELTWQQAFHPTQPAHPGLITELYPNRYTYTDFLARCQLALNELWAWCVAHFHT
jgi:hypothetical protein